MIIPLAQGHDKDRSLIGGKAKNLAILMKAGLQVPDGFVISFRAFMEFIDTNNLMEQITHLLQTQKNPNQHIKKLFEQHELPHHLEQQIKKEYIDLLSRTGESLVAVRSSAAAEDLEHQSFAGQYETFLNVGSYQSFITSIKKCWVSVWSSQALQYGEHKIDISQMKFSILVQSMIQADKSGVAFSVNPIPSSNDEIVINATYGLGEAVVAGIITPDMYIVSKQTHSILHKELGDKVFKIIGTEGGTKSVPTLEQEKVVFCMDDKEINQLTTLINRIEDFYQFPIDMEFAMKEQIAYVLQVRPITTLKEGIQIG